MDDRGDLGLRARLADVFPLTFLALAALKAWDVQLDHGPVVAVAWVAACVAALRWRAGWVTLAALAFGSFAAADEVMASNHAVLIGLVAAIVAGGVAVDRLLWTQTIAVYLFATLNKINADYFDGSGIANRSPDIPFPALLAVAGVAVEGWLCWAVWRRHRWALPVAIVLHAGIVVAMSTTLYQWALLGSFNGMLVLLVWRAVHGNREPSPRMLAA